MNKQRIIEIKNELCKNKPNELYIKELYDYLIGSCEKQTGFMVKDIIAKLLEYYIDKEFGEEGE